MVIKNRLTLLWEHTYDIISHSIHMFNIPVYTFFYLPTGD